MSILFSGFLNNIVKENFFLNLTQNLFLIVGLPFSREEIANKSNSLPWQQNWTILISSQFNFFTKNCPGKFRAH